MTKVTNIPGRLHSVEQGNIVAGANEIYDDTKGKKQNVINSETDAELLRLEQTKQDNLTFDNAPTENSNNPVKSGGVYAADLALQQAIEAILLLIPSAATAVNQLADKAFVNSSISTATATFRGTYNVVTDLHLDVDATHAQIEAALASVVATADNNDYCYVQIPVSSSSQDIQKTSRYKFNGSAWVFEYDLNTSGFTSAQWAAINSGITAALVTKLGDLPYASELSADLSALSTAIGSEETRAKGVEQGLSTAVQGILDLIPSAATSSNKLTDKAYVDGLIQAISALIPAEATDQNQLADKAYVLAQILAATPAFKGQFTTFADLDAVSSPKAGDIGIVRTTDSDGFATFTFYQYLNSQWNVYYTLAHHLQNKPATTGTTGDYPYNGMGRVVLPMNIKEIGGVTANYLEQSMMPTATGGNTIYVITHDYVLATDITIPANCVLEFECGSLTGNSITGNNTYVEINQSTPMLNNIKMLGSFHAKEFPLNLYNTTKIDYLYTLLQSFSGTNFVLKADYSVTETDSTVDGTAPHTLNLEGNGYKLTLHSFGAYGMTKCSIKNITIEAQNYSVGSWHTDTFKFGVLGNTGNATLDLYNATFTSGVERIYMRSFKSINILNCLEDGVSFYVATSHCVTVKDCRVVNALGGYLQINDGLTPDSEDFTTIDNCYFKNLSEFGIILSGGIKMNPCVINCNLINVGSDGATEACINMHPKGTVIIKNNYIVANVGAVPLDIDAARSEFFSDDTVVFVENNVIKNTSQDTTLHALALIGLRRLFFRNNIVTDQILDFWGSVDAEISDNMFNFTNGFTVNTYIGDMQGYNFIQYYRYNHYFKRNIFNIPESIALAVIRYNGNGLIGDVFAIGNIWNGVRFLIYSNNLNIYGDIINYNGSNNTTKRIVSDNSYIEGYKNTELWPRGLRRYNSEDHKEIRGSLLGQVDINMNPPGTLYVGNTASRPTLCLPGTAYYDLTLGKMIYAQGTKAKLSVQITSGLTSADGSIVSDTAMAYMKNMVICCKEKTTNSITLSSIFEYFERGDIDYTYFKNCGLLAVSKNWGTYTLTITCIYVGAIGNDYGVEHSNTVNGFTTEHSLVNDGSIEWADAAGNIV